MFALLDCSSGRFCVKFFSSTQIFVRVCFVEGKDNIAPVQVFKKKTKKRSVQTLISAMGVNFNLGFFFFSSKAFSRIVLSGIQSLSRIQKGVN